jgi:uncharacterized protein YaaN involved in tellurite resistance
VADELVPAPSSAPAAPPAPVAPTSLDANERVEIETRARDMVLQIRTQPEDRSLARGVSRLGSDAQQKAGAEMELLKTRVGSLLSDLDGDAAKIPQGLVALRRTMDQINPHVLAKSPRGFFSKLLRRMPVVGDVLADIAVRYESVQTQIDTIVNSLRVGKDELLQDSLELERLYDSVRAAQVEVQEAAYLGELLWQQLESSLAEAGDPTEAERLRTIVHRIAMRVQDLRTMEQVNTQFFVSIDMTIQNNDHLSDAITRTVTVTQSLLTVGLAIQAALANQKRILGAVRETQEYTAEMLAANASSIRQQTGEIGDLYTNPVLALDKVKQAYDELNGAMEELDQIRRTGTESARRGVEQLNEMTASLAPKADALRAAREFDGAPDVAEVDER